MLYFKRVKPSIVSFPFSLPFSLCKAIEVRAYRNPLLSPLSAEATFEVQSLFTGGKCGKALCPENQAAGIWRQTISPFLLLQRTLNRKKVADAKSTSICSMKEGKTQNDSQNIQYNCD